MTVNCAHCARPVKLKQKNGKSPIGKCRCGKYVKAVGMGLTDEMQIKEWRDAKKSK